MKHNEAIAAIIAANTPLKAARYAVDNPPAAEIAHLLDEVVDLYDAIGAALALVRQQSYGAAEIVLEHALKGKPMPPPEPKPEPPKDNDPLPNDAPGGPNDSVPGDERD